MNTDYRLEMIGITKDYSENRVLDNVELKVGKGEIHALMGENGAGKSTLMNILFGMPVIHNTGGFKGTIKIDGQEVKIDSPQKALELGIGMVHQEFMLIPGFTVTENIKVGREITTPTVASKIFGHSLESLDREAMQKDARKALDTIGLNIDENDKVGGMPVGYMQFIEIAREIDKTGIRLLIFDEPTAVLTESEADRLLDAMRVIAAQDISIIFITHRLDEVISVTNSMTVLRDGQYVGRVETKDTTAETIAQMMIGRAVQKLVDKTEETRTINESDVMLKLRNFEVDMPGEMVKGVDLDVRRGEILGIGGLAGQGKIGIGGGIMGLYETRGTVELDGKVLDLSKLGTALKNGIGFVSEDRKGVGLLLEESIEENIVFSAMQINNGFLKNFGITKQFDKKATREHAEKMIKSLDIRCTGPTQPVGALSGGNQQKVCVARALALNPKLLIVSEPTRGIDIGAKKLVLELLAQLNKEQGMTVVIISSELNELRSVADRIAIITEGQVAGILSPDDSDAKFGLLMSGM
ncbi:MAG: sugar ABC transporter ATP-binding protein [Anaerofustis stercorihominis]|nr:sugar ABC transporter ATP-binding protein [Anaerofustis stercorihominis]